MTRLKLSRAPVAAAAAVAITDAGVLLALVIVMAVGLVLKWHGCVWQDSRESRPTVGSELALS